MAFTSNSQPTNHAGKPLPSRGAGSHRDPSVLVIDQDNRALSASYLRHGWQAKTVTSVGAGLVCIDQEEFDLIACNMLTRDGSVYDILSSLQDRKSSTPVIALSEQIEVGDVVKVVRAGAFDFHFKSLPMEHLQAMSRAALSRDNAPVLSSLSDLSPSSSMDVRSDEVSNQTLSEHNRIHLIDALRLSDGNRTKAAKILGVSVRTVRNKVKQYGLPPRREA
jgi:DNA-binding NtrC family response regulator